MPQDQNHLICESAQHAARAVFYRLRVLAVPMTNPDYFVVCNSDKAGYSDRSPTPFPKFWLTPPVTTDTDLYRRDSQHEAEIIDDRIKRVYHPIVSRAGENVICRFWRI